MFDDETINGKVFFFFFCILWGWSLSVSLHDLSIGLINMLQQHFQDLHPKDFTMIPREGFYPHCEWCTMQCNPSYPRHIH